MLVLILGTGVFLTAGLRFMPLRKLGYGFSMLWKGRDSQGAGDISPFNALMTSLSATIGTGNIAGVGTAIAIGGPGAVFWMWCTALVGMATKYAEAVLAVKYRETDEEGNHVGGPMYYIKNGLGKKWQWLGMAFAIFGAIAGFGIGNMVQANSVADAVNTNLGIPKLATGIIMAVLVFLVLIGGIQRIAQVAGKLVPFMGIAYVLGGLIVILVNITAVPEAIMLIITYAFTPSAATGGFAGAAVMVAIQMGVARGIFSNEAGLGSAPIAHAAAFGLGLPGIGEWIVTFGLIIFAFTTLMGWSVYGERCVEYLFGVKSIMPFRILWVLAIPLGATVKLAFVWLLADTLNALMAIPNLIALLLLAPVVFKLTKEYFLNRPNHR